MPSNSLTKLNFIDIFSGAGGLSCGLEMAGHKCLLGVDHDKEAIKTFLYNHKNAKAFSGNIKDLNIEMIKDLTSNQKIDIVVGGPPCQGFSTVGVGNPNDLRNKLFLEFVRIVKETSPSYIVIENVTGLVAKKNEKILKSILRQFEKLGYHLDVQVLSSHYYGVPEKRRRTIIIGSRLDNSIIFPKMTHDISKQKVYIPAVTVGDAFKNLKSKNGEIFNHDIELAKVKSKLDESRIKKIPEGKGIRYEKDETTYLPPRLRLGIDWKNIPENRFRQTKYQRLDRNMPSPTIMTHRHNYYHPFENRFLTQREAAKLQSFPNNFIFQGPLTAQWRQIGNAVPPLLGKAIGQAIKKMHTTYLNEDLGKINEKSKKKITNQKKIQSMRKNAFMYSKTKKKLKNTQIDLT